MLNSKVLERLQKVNLTSEELISIFNQLSEALSKQDAEQVVCTFGYANDEDLQPGDFIPMIQLVLTKHTPLAE